MAATIEDKLEMIMGWMATRRGRKRNQATTSELARQFHAKPERIDHVMVEAFNRGLVWRHRNGKDFYYVRRTII